MCKQSTDHLCWKTKNSREKREYTEEETMHHQRYPPAQGDPGEVSIQIPIHLLIWVVGGKDNWKKNKVYQIRCRKWNSVQVYQFRLKKVSNGRASSNQQNRLQNVWLSSPFAQFVSPWAICGSVTPVLASLLCSWGSDIINCYTIKIYTKYYDYDCMWVLDESESLTTSYQIIFQIKHGQNANVLRVGGCNLLRVSKLSCFHCPVTMRSDGGCPIAAFGRFLLTSTGIYLWCWGCAICWVWYGPFWHDRIKIKQWKSPTKIQELL